MNRIIILLSVLLYGSGYTNVLASCIPKETILIDPVDADVTATTVKIKWTLGSGDVNPSDVVILYKLKSSSAWINWGPAGGSADGTVTGLTSGSSYDFMLLSGYPCLLDEFGEPFYFPSAVKTITLDPLAPTLSSANSISGNSFVASWQPPEGSVIIGYRLDVSEKSDFSTFVSGYSNLSLGNINQYTVTGLSEGLTYYYRVRAVNSGGESVNSNVMSALTFPSSPLFGASNSITTNSFTLTWNAVLGASSYQLQVATDNSFNSVLPDFNNVSVTGVSKLVNGLLPNKNYYCRVRALNQSGFSIYSGIRAELTVAAPPANFVVAQKRTNALIVQWESIPNIQTYKVEVSLSNSFDIIIPGYNPKLISDGTSSLTIQDLTAGTPYYFRIAAMNGTGIYSAPTILKGYTICDSPIGLGVMEVLVSNVNVKSFKASWTPTFGAESYRLDVASDENFTISSLISNYNNLSIISPNADIIGLQASTTYYYRVRAINDGGSGVSSNSLPGVVLGVPQISDIPESKVHETSIEISWNDIIGANKYEVFVSEREDFSTTVSGYPKITTLTSLPLDGLAPATIHYIKVRARNANVVSADSRISAKRTNSLDGEKVVFKIEAKEFSKSISGDDVDQQLISVIVNGNGLGNITALLYHRKCSSTDYQVESLSQNGPIDAKGQRKFSISLNKNWLDDLGMQFYFEVFDEYRNADSNRDKPNTIVRKREAKIPLQRFGKDVKNYHIISLPDSLTEKSDRDIEGLMVGLLGEYRDTQWRMLHFENGELVDYPKLKVEKMKRGLGYWFVSKSQVIPEFKGLDLGRAATYNNTIDKPFLMELKKGWNQIGNPYPYSLNWLDVLSIAGNAAKVNKELWIFDHENLKFAESNLLPAYSGGYVFAKESNTLVFPTTLPKQSSGRVHADSYELTTDASGWILPFTLKQGDISNLQSGIGMKEDALEGIDRHDLIPPPNFIRYLQFLSKPVGESYSFARSIVPRQNNYTWNYTLEQNGDSPASLTWDTEKVKQTGGQLLLHDLTNHLLIEMSSVNEYVLNSGSAKFKIYYSDVDSFAGKTLQFGVPSPNPFHTIVEIPFDYSGHDIDKSVATLTISDIHGREIMNKVVDYSDHLSVEKMTWDGKTHKGDDAPSGVYIFKLKVIKPGNSELFSGKVVKQ